MATTRSEPILPVLIAGAGLSGLSLAALHTHKQVPFILFETSSRSREAQNYGVKLYRGAYEPLIRALASEEDYEGAVEAFKRYLAVDARIGRIYRVETAAMDAATGEPHSDDVESENKGCFCTNSDRLLEWLLQRVEQPKLDLGGVCGQKVILIGDAAHAMPGISAEGESHCLLDGVELAAVLADIGKGADIARVGRAFYDRMVER